MSNVGNRRSNMKLNYESPVVVVTVFTEPVKLNDTSPVDTTAVVLPDDIFD